MAEGQCAVHELLTENIMKLLKENSDKLDEIIDRQGENHSAIQVLATRVENHKERIEEIKDQREKAWAAQCKREGDIWSSISKLKKLAYTSLGIIVTLQIITPVLVPLVVSYFKGK